MSPAIYEIRDGTGALIALHERHDGPGAGHKRFTWRMPDGALGLGGMPVAHLPLYGIDRLDGLSTTVVIVEGEKATEALWTLGIAAVGTVTGAAATPDTVAIAELTGRWVILWADNDEVGRSHMERLARALASVAPGVRLVTWPEAPAHGDAADFVAGGGTRDQVQALLDAARPIGAGADAIAAAGASEPWEPPLSLDHREGLPAFPVIGLPDWVRAFVIAEAEATQTPIDMAAMFALAALATVTAGHVEVEPVAGWREGVNLFVVVAMEPGSRKSAVHRDVMAPILGYERLLVEGAQPDIAEQATIRRIAEASLAKAEKSAASAKDQLERLAFEDEAAPSPPRWIGLTSLPRRGCSLLT